MSLIHKALNKVDKKPNQEIDQVSLVEEQLIEEESNKFMSFELNKRTIVLVVLVVLAAAFAIYSNFFMDEDGGKDAKKAPVTAVPAASPVKAEPAVPTSTRHIAEGISKSSKGVQYPLLPEAKALSEDAKRYFQSGDLNMALTKFNEALEIAPKSPDILNSLGLIYKKKGDLNTAQKYYAKALEYGPECAECYNNLGVLEADKGDEVGAVLNLKRAILLAPTYADPYFNLAVVMEKEGNFRSAVDSYKKFLMYTTTTDEELKNQVIDRIEDLALNWDSEIE